MIHLSEMLNLRYINIISLSVIFYPDNIYIIACVRLNYHDMHQD